MTDDIFAGAFAPDQEPVADVAPAPAPEPAPEPAPDAPQEPEPQLEPEALPAPEAREQVPPGHVPLAALLDVRDKLKAAEARLQAQPPPQSFDVPDPFDDPAGYQQWTVSQAEAARWDAVTSVSQVMANEKHGEDKVKEATDAFMAEAESKPWLIAELRQQAHPYEYVVRRQQTQALVSQLSPDDIAGFQAWKAAQAATQTPMAVLAATPQPTPAAPPPRSLASATSASGAAAPPPGTAYDALFSKG